VGRLPERVFFVNFVDRCRAVVLRRGGAPEMPFSVVSVISVVRKVV
jgi:hypothetical protein